MTTSIPVKRPEPVVEAATLAGRISGLVSAVGFCFVIVGWASPQQVQTWAVAAGGVVTALGAVLAYLLPIILARGARAQVTPLESPRTVDGTPLAAAAPSGGADLAPLRQIIEGGLASLDPAGTVAPPAPAPAPESYPQPDDPAQPLAPPTDVLV